MAPVRPKLVATDLDGTLVRKDGTVSPYTRQVLAGLEAQGVPVIFVTGRPLRWTTPVFEHVGSHGLAIVSNGALVWDVAEQIPRMTRALESGASFEVASRIRAALPGSLFGAERVDGFAVEPGFPGGREDAPQQELSELTAGPMLKLLSLHPDQQPDDYWKRAAEVVGDLATVTHSSTFALLEISAYGVTKASTLAQVAESLGVGAEDVIAFGDMPNDLAMLTWAGRSFAMADAHPEVRECAGEVAPSHEEDGVARVLAEVFDL
ncbi:HAD family hydrolase [Nocardioides sp. BP30]|uniref:HAD family hydrolase n=1 Tax=Nocardioides sp. BP30 TaxID=3036374 RepID=UPI00246944B5|nr:HAD family hydrolase [Nocardioides sp. BP30]WGL52649.1 HAD family hydrolase [Nocardioides sp. BP30]